MSQYFWLCQYNWLCRLQLHPGRLRLLVCFYLMQTRIIPGLHQNHTLQVCRSRNTNEAIPYIASFPFLPIFRQYFMVIIMLVMHWNACLFAMIGNMATAAAVNTWKSDEVDESQNFCNLVSLSTSSCGFFECV